jgi:long-chain acyl-CoA synthetase
MPREIQNVTKSLEEDVAIEDTLPKNLRIKCKKDPDKDAMRVKDRGIWVTYSWRDYYENVKYFCLGLMSLGFKRRDTVSIIGENKPEWFWAELAAHGAGGVISGIFADCAPEEVKYFVQSAESRFAVVHDQEQVDKFLMIRDEIPLIEKVIYWDPKGLWNYEDPLLMSFTEVQDLGREYEKKHPNLFGESIDQGKGDDVAVISWTSGTTGLPKGTMFTHSYLCGLAVDWAKLDGWYGKNYEHFSLMPPAWAIEQLMGIACSFLCDLVVNFAEEPETLQADLREVGPQLLIYGTRQWESVSRTVQAKMIDSSFLRRFIYKMCLPLGLKVADIYIDQNRKAPNLGLKILYFMAYQAVFRQLRDRLGLSRLKVSYTGGAALSPDIIRYFKALGIEIQLTYGSTEMGWVSLPRQGELRPETSGRPLPWVDLKISDEGEILVKNKWWYAGYYKNPEATQKNLNEEGYFKSGDYGYLDESGHLIVIDRLDDLKPLAGGKKFSPQFVEVRLRFSPYIKEVIALGSEERTFVSVLINIDIDNMGRYADANRINYTTFTDLSQKPEVIDLIKKEIAKINRILPEEARVNRFVNLHKEFDPDEAELTRTRKLRRGLIEERYRDLVEAIYGDQDEVNVEAEVTYQDGRTGVIKTQIKVNSVDGST